MLTFRRTRKGDETRLDALLRGVAAADPDLGLSEHKAARIGGSADSVAVSAIDGGDVVGYAQAAWHPGASMLSGSGHWGIELVVDPGHSVEQVVDGLLAALRSRLPPAAVIGVWSSDDQLTEVLSRSGFSAVRELVRLGARLPLNRHDHPPEGFRFEPFRPGRDDASWLELNNRAFLDHPENGSLTRDDLIGRMSMDWFDPEGFVLGWDGNDLAGFCWTKLHNIEQGEIYIIAVDPERQGRGLGGALLSAGAAHLAGRGVSRIILYVESRNRKALALYRAFGFEAERAFRQLIPGG